MTPPSSTFFSASPNWEWLIICYFFIGGLAGGCYFLAVLLDLFGRVGDRPLARLGYLVAFPAVVVSGILLTLDLGQPLRFWHMLLQSNRIALMFKPWSPMSIGSWALLAFGAFSFVSFLAALEWRRFHVFRPPALLGIVVAILGGALGFFVAGYTGILLAVTNRPIWADTNLLGLVFVVSAASTSISLLILLAYRRRGAIGTVHALGRFDVWVLVLELVTLVALVVSLGPVATVWLSGWGALLGVGVFLIGILIPLALHARPRTLGGLSLPTAAVLTLIGGFVLRVVIVMSAQAV
jgi:formate-dependent nitrite reductase membrane component NrfD